MPRFVPKRIFDIPRKFLCVLGESHIPEQDKPVFTKKAKFLLTVVGALVVITLFVVIPQNMILARKIGVFSFGVSAFLWFTAATIPTPLPMSYASGPPEKVIKRANWQTWCNQAGAIFTALGLILQFVS